MVQIIVYEKNGKLQIEVVQKFLKIQYISRLVSEKLSFQKYTSAYFKLVNFVQ